jgi:hypothetical protein
MNAVRRSTHRIQEQILAGIGANKRQQRHLACALDGGRQRALVLGTRATATAGQNLAAL